MLLADVLVRDEKSITRNLFQGQGQGQGQAQAPNKILFLLSIVILEVN